MGKATRWLKGMLGMKKDKEKAGENFNTSSSVSSEKREKKRWSFSKSGKETNVNVSGNVKDGVCIRSYIVEREIERNKHAIAVAAATAAAADAAVAAAQAAVAVVRLTSRGRGTIFGSGTERLAAAKIQSVFRGYLARKALRALKGLVKLQAIVRGYLVRKRAAATLHSMQALIRAQTNLRSQRARQSINKENRHPARRSIDKCNEAGSEFHSTKRLSNVLGSVDETPKIVEIDTYKPLSRSQPISSPLPCPNPARITIPECKNHPDFDWYITGEEPKLSTAQSTPRLANSISYNVAVTPAKSVCGDSYLRPYSNSPNYMANTQSFNAKLRSHSAPKRRPETPPKKRISLCEMMASRNSISSIKLEWTDQSTKLMEGY